MNPPAVFRDPFRLERRNPFAATEPFENAGDFSGFLRRSKDRHILANDFLGPVPIRLLRGPIPGEDRTVQGLVENRIFR